MKIFAPDYYKDFRCAAGGCKHSCCAGWEIDIDEETAGYYKNIPGEFGERLRRNIDFGEECSCFILGEKERCPFLNEKGLCDIIINLGEESLCQVCDDHPRFRNFFETRTEIGLGLCCEAAAKLILEKQSKTEILEISDDGEEVFANEAEMIFFEKRKAVFDILQERSLCIEKRIEKMLDFCGAPHFEMDFAKWAEMFLGLERLDEKWTEILENIKKNPALPEISDSIGAEQLICCFVFRHFSAEEDFWAKAIFAAMSFYMTEKAAEQVGIFESARLYSSEIEYSDENIEKIMDFIYEEVQK